MNISNISVDAYTLIADDIAASGTIMLAGTWPITVGTHPDFPGSPILIGHVQDRAFLITLDPVPERETDAAEPRPTLNAQAVQ